MRLIVGLGNPGKPYENTRHNVGFLFMEYLREVWGFPEFRDSPFRGLVSEGVYRGERTVLLKPMTYMNISGESATALLRYYHIPLTDCLVVSDDVTMAFGRVRYRDSGSAGGHNGLKSLIHHLGEDFARIKIGIGRDECMPLDAWVLGRF